MSEEIRNDAVQNEYDASHVLFGTRKKFARALGPRCVVEVKNADHGAFADGEVQSDGKIHRGYLIRLFFVAVRRGGQPQNAAISRLTHTIFHAHL